MGNQLGKDNLIEKLTRYLNKYFTKEKAIQEMIIKATIRCCYTPIKMAKTKRTDHYEGW